MTHNEVYKWFELYFPLYAGENAATWFQTVKTASESGRPMALNLYLPMVAKTTGGLKPLKVLSKA